MEPDRKEDRQVRLLVEKTSDSVVALHDKSRYGVGRLIGTRSGEGLGAQEALFLVRVGDSADREMTVSIGECLPVPRSLDADVALLAPLLAWSLWIWDKLDLELGEVAVYTDGHPLWSFVGQAARWRGGYPVVRLSMDRAQTLAGADEVLYPENPEETVKRLGERIKEKPGVTAVDLTGRPEIVDILLETIPQWGRLMLLGPNRGALTIDFYKNVHRKGLRIFSSVIDCTFVFDLDKEKESAEQLRKAYCILENKKMAQTCLGFVSELQPG